MRANYPHSWLLGQLKQVVNVETFADYESNEILEPIFEFDDDSKLPNWSHFAYDRPSKYYLRHSSF
jgi:hypothetical protein